MSPGGQAVLGGSVTPPLNPPLSAPPTSASARRLAPAAPSESPKPARRRVVAFAALASGLLVATVLAYSVIGPNGGDSSLHATEIDPEAYTAETVGRVAALSTADLLPSAGAVTGSLPVGTEAQVEAALEAAIADAMQALSDALAAAALPEVPVDYVVGEVPDVQLPPVQGYAEAVFPAGPVTGSLAGVTFDTLASPVGPRENSLPIEDAVSQVETALKTLEDLLGGTGLPVGTDDLPVGVPELPFGLGPDVPSQASGAQDTVEPDEQGAALAGRHATALLGATTGVYATTSTDLTALLASYQELAARVEETIETTRDIQDETTADINADLEQRLRDIDAQVRSLSAQAARLAAEHSRIADKAHAQAEAAVQAALDAQLAAVEDARVQALANVTGRVQAVQQKAEATKADVQALVATAVMELERSGSPDALAGADAVKAAGVAAVMKIEREAKAEIQSIEATRTGIEAQADAIQDDLAEQAQSAFGEADMVLDDAKESAAEAKAYLLAVAQAQGSLAETRELEVANEAIASLEASADEHVEKVLRAALKATEAADGILETTSGLVADIEDTSSIEVEKDLKYIEKVSDDYGRVPTDERKERASHWSNAASEIDGLLGATLAKGEAIELLAQRAMAAAAQAQAQIESMA